MKMLSKLVAASILTSAIAIASPHSLDKSHTNVGFSVKHLMITNTKGDFKQFDGEIDFDYAAKSFNSLEAIMKVASIDTDNVKRDKHLKSDDFFDGSNYPEITFKMKSYKADGNEGKMVGDLTMRGVTKEVTLNVEELATIKDFAGNNRVGFTLSGKIDRTDFGLNWNKALELGGVAVSNTVKLLAEIQAIEK